MIQNSSNITFDVICDNDSFVGHWNLNPDFLEIVPQHWLQYPPPSWRIHYTLGVLYLLIVAPGAMANMAVIWLFVRAKALRTPSNILVLNLAVSDLMMNSKMPLFIYNSFSLGPATGILGCRIYGLVGGLSGTSAILTITAMAIERYNTISRPLDPDSKMTRSKAARRIIFIWTYTLLFCLPPLFGLNRYVPEGYLTSCTFDYLNEDWVSRGFVLTFFVAAWCVPIIAICWCYIGMVVVVRGHERKFDFHASKMRQKGNLSRKRGTEIKLAKIAFCLIALWFAAWTPYAIVALIGAFINRDSLTPMASMVPALFCKTASILDPFVYGLNHPKFKQEFRRLLNSIFRCRQVHAELSRSVRSIESTVSENYEMDLVNPGFTEATPDASVSQSNPEQVSNMKVFFIPQVYNMSTKGDEVKIQCRRSI